MEAQEGLNAGLVSLVFTNSSLAFCTRGKSKLMRVSPTACGAPGNEHSFIRHLLQPEAVFAE